MDKKTQHPETEKKKKKLTQERILSHALDQFERSKVITIRVDELSQGEEILCKHHKSSWTFLQIAEQELLENVLDMEIERLHPNGEPETWNIKELKKR